MAKHTSNERRKLLCEMVFDKNMSIKEACKVLDINYKTGHSICRVFLDEERSDRKNITGKKRTFDRNYQAKIINYFEQFPDATLSACKNFLQSARENDELIPSIATIDRILKRSKISFKTVSIVPEQRNSASTIDLRKQFAMRFTRFEGLGANFVYLDEFGCKMSMRRSKARSRIGTAATITTPGRRGNNLSVCAAIDSNGPIHFLAKFHAFNQDQYQLFLRELNEKLDICKRNILIMDNASFHKTIAVRELVKRELKLEILYLPPYSPMLNPIEECFSKVENFIKTARCNSDLSLLESVKSAFDSVTAANCASWCRHSKQFFPQCINERPIQTEPEEISDFESYSGHSDSEDELLQNF